MLFVMTQQCFDALWQNAKRRETYATSDLNTDIFVKPALSRSLHTTMGARRKHQSIRTFKDPIDLLKSSTYAGGNSIMTRFCMYARYT